MKHVSICRAAAFAAASCLLATAASATPNTWTFSQSYGANGTISGAFTGDDLNADGLITFLDGLGNELLGLTLTFTGPAFTGSFSQAQMIIGGIDSTITEFQYVVGSTNMDAILPGTPVKPSVVTLNTPVLPGTTPSNAFVYWTAGSATYDPLGALKGNVTIFNTFADILGDYQTSSQVQIGVATAVPEPSTYLMLAAGLAVVGTAGRRRARTLVGV